MENAKRLDKKKKKNKRVTIIIWHEKGQVRQEKGCCLIASTYHSIKWQLDQPYVAQSKSPRGWTRSFCVSRFLTDRVIGRHWFFTCRAKMVHLGTLMFALWESTVFPTLVVPGASICFLRFFCFLIRCPPSPFWNEKVRLNSTNIVFFFWSNFYEFNVYLSNSWNVFSLWW